MAGAKASTGAHSPAKDGASAAKAASNGQQGLQSDAAGTATRRLHVCARPTWVAQAMPERLQDEVALDLGDGAADERTRDLLGGERGVGDRRRAALPFGGRTLARRETPGPGENRGPGVHSAQSPLGSSSGDPLARECAGER